MIKLTQDQITEDNTKYNNVVFLSSPLNYYGYQILEPKDYSEGIARFIAWTCRSALDKISHRNERKIGFWTGREYKVSGRHPFSIYTCSVCGCCKREATCFCPDCGSIMDEDIVSAEADYIYETDN